MKETYILMRVVRFADGTEARMTRGVFSDETDALKASDAFVASLDTLTDDARALLKYLGIVGFGGVAIRQPFTPGSGLVAVESPGLVGLNGKPLVG